MTGCVTNPTDNASTIITMKTMHMKRLLPFFASLPLLAGCVVYEQPAPPPPPAAQVEVVPGAPGPVAIWYWVPGAWEWRGSWVWVGGRWAARPHPGAVWVGSGWGWHGHRRVWVSGYWR
jgi:hypothetical protein